MTQKKPIAVQLTELEFEGTVIGIVNNCKLADDADHYTYNNKELYLGCERLTEQFYGSDVPQDNAEYIAQGMAHWINIGWMNANDTIHWLDEDIYFKVNRSDKK